MLLYHSILTLLFFTWFYCAVISLGFILLPLCFPSLLFSHVRRREVQPQARWGRACSWSIRVELLGSRWFPSRSSTRALWPWESSSRSVALALAQTSKYCCRCRWCGLNQVVKIQNTLSARKRSVVFIGIRVHSSSNMEDEAPSSVQQCGMGQGQRYAVGLLYAPAKNRTCREVVSYPFKISSPSTSSLFALQTNCCASCDLLGFPVTPVT